MANWSLDSISGRTMTLSATLDEDYHYHVNPVRTGTNMLKCDGLASSAGDVPVKDYTYVIYREPWSGARRLPVPRPSPRRPASRRALFSWIGADRPRPLVPDPVAGLLISPPSPGR